MHLDEARQLLRRFPILFDRVKNEREASLWILQVYAFSKRLDVLQGIIIARESTFRIHQLKFLTL